ncbi:hypothetical protein D3C79_580580 [compost metagenome]
MQHRRNDPGRAIGRRRDHAPTGCVFLIHRQRVEVDPLHGAQGRADHIGLVQFLQAAIKLGRPALHIQPAGQNPFVLQTVFDTGLHGLPELQQTGANLRFATPDLLVFQHQLRHAQVVFLAQFQQFHSAVEIVGEHGVIGVQHTTGGLRRIHHKAAADRVIGIAVQLARRTFSNQGHGVGVVRQVLVEQQHVARPDKADVQPAIEQQSVCFAQCGDAGADLRRVDSVRPLAHQAHDDRIVAAVTDPRGRQRAVQAHLDAAHLLELTTFTQALDEQCRSPHGPDGMRAGRADANLEQVEHTDGHATYLLIEQPPPSQAKGVATATLNRRQSAEFAHHQAFERTSDVYNRRVLAQQRRQLSRPFLRRFFAVQKQQNCVYGVG